jgi:hypothetical protein
MSGWSSWESGPKIRDVIFSRFEPPTRQAVIGAGLVAAGAVILAM